jgi:hypothetical protein
MRQVFGDATERADEDDKAVDFSRSFIATLEGGIKVRIAASCYVEYSHRLQVINYFMPKTL